MGAVFNGRVGRGQAVAIATGGFVPDGADGVVMVEHTHTVGERTVAVDAADGARRERRPAG